MRVFSFRPPISFAGNLFAYRFRRVSHKTAAIWDPRKKNQIGNMGTNQLLNEIKPNRTNEKKNLKWRANPIIEIDFAMRYMYIYIYKRSDTYKGAITPPPKTVEMAPDQRRFAKFAKLTNWWQCRDGYSVFLFFRYKFTIYMCVCANCCVCLHVFVSKLC